MHRRTGRAATSQRNQHLVTDQVQANAGWLGAVKEVGRNRFPHIVAKFLPGSTLREDAFSEALRAKPAIAFLNDFKDKLVHASMLHEYSLDGQRDG